MPDISAPETNKSFRPSLVTLSGTKRQMGKQYGEQLESNLKQVYDILINYYVEERGVKMSTIAAKAQLFYDKYPYSYQQFIKGMAEGAKLTLEQAQILNGMETLNSLVKEKQEISACSFISVPASKSETNATLIGRNYDFLPPFDKCAKYLTVTVINEFDHVPSAFVGFAGQFYCPTCVNQNGLFVELNNGMPSGGFKTDHSRTSLLINLLEAIQNSEDMTQLNRQLSTLNSDYSLVINTANSTHVKSFEFSASKSLMLESAFVEDLPTVSTNFFINSDWNQTVPDDDKCWLGVTRRNNLLAHLETDDKLSVLDLQNIMDLNIDQGGAKWDYTLYQIIFDPAALALDIKTPQISENWHHYELKEYFQQTSEPFFDRVMGLIANIAE